MDSTATAYSFEQMMRICDMAFDYLSIDSSKKENIIRLLEEKIKAHSDISLTDIFKQEKLISDEEIEYTRIFDAHLKTLNLDQQFGRLAIANGLVAEKEVAKALNHQKTYFEKYRINVTIGDVLTENKSLSTHDRIAILLTQNRIKDENLLEALNDIGTTLQHKDMVNKQFGVLAIKKELVTIEQVNAALEVQKEERQTHSQFRFIGQILQETAQLSNEDILQILLEQNQFEKRRLNLEKALYTVNSEIKISKKLNKLFEYRVSIDGLDAVVKKKVETKGIIPVYEFVLWLRRAGIKIGVANDAVLEEFIQTAEKYTQIIVAKGQPPKPCTNEKIQFYFENEFTEDKKHSQKLKNAPEKENALETIKKEDNSLEKKTDKNESTALKEENALNKKEGVCIVEKGTLLARIIPGKKGKPGKNVLGYPIQPLKPLICVLNAGAGVIKKGPVFISRIDGRPSLKNNTLLTIEPLEEKSKIKTIVGSIHSDTEKKHEYETVVLKGTITPEGVLRCRSLLLNGKLLGRVICSGDIDVKGDIGRDERQKDGENSGQTDLFSNGSVTVSKSIVNTKLQAAGELFAYNSTVIGSEVIAGGGMNIRNVLAGEHAPSVLRFGLKPENKIIATDQSLEMKNEQLSVLKKEKEISTLIEEYEKELKEEETHQIEQNILKNLVEIIEAPELYQQESLEEKIRYLNRLPDFSSIKAYYFKTPQTDTLLAYFNQFVALAEKISLGKVLQQIKKKITPESGPEEAETGSRQYQIETQFKGRLTAFEQEIADHAEEIEILENQIQQFKALRSKLCAVHLDSFPHPAAIKIRNKCEKGTVIKGIIARHDVEKTIYNVRFKEVMDPKTHRVSITIETN
jgi:uncharacterized protein (DUF342 family)